LARGLTRFRGGSQFSTWAYRVAVNASIDELRRRQRRPGPVSELPMPAVAGSEGVDGSADRVDVDAALRQLPVEFRAPVVLRDLCGLDYAEIASVLDIPIGTVRSRIARGRSALLPLLTGNPEPAPERPTAQP
jgi:RNA polymerase sigma-70 factor (ECF subfamily)